MIYNTTDTILNKTGTKLKIRNDSKYYKIGNLEIKDSGEIYFLQDGLYYTHNDNRLYFCSIDKIYKSQRYAPKVIGVIDIVNDELIIDTFDSKYASDFRLYYKDKKSYTITYLIDLSKNKNYRRNFHNGSYYHIKGNLATETIRDQNFIKQYKTKFPYNVDEAMLSQVSNIMKENPIDSNTLDKYDFNNLPEFINNFTFGLEFETTGGLFNITELYKLGIIPLRDGSIKGIEYVTVPLKGVEGFYRLFEIIEFLKKNTKNDNSCSLHLHLGGVPRTESFVLAFYKTLCVIQEEYFDLFPVYKKYNLGIKNKNYSSPLPVIELTYKLDKTITPSNVYKNFSVIYELLTGNHSFTGTIDDIQYHPKNQQEDHKWNMDARYYFINLIPLIFGNKKTIEFRIHEESYNFNNIFSFILFNMVITEFVRTYEVLLLQNPYDILQRNNNFKYIINKIDVNKKNNKIFNLLYDYVDSRKMIREQLFSKGLISDSVDKELHCNLNSFLKTRDNKKPEEFTVMNALKEVYVKKNNIDTSTLSYSDYIEINKQMYNYIKYSLGTPQEITTHKPNEEKQEYIFKPFL